MRSSGFGCDPCGMSALEDSPAEVGFLEGDRVPLVEAAHVVEDLGRHHECVRIVAGRVESRSGWQLVEGKVRTVVLGLGRPAVEVAAERPDEIGLSGALVNGHRRNESCSWLGFERLDQLDEDVGMDEVVVVQEEQVFALGELASAVAGDGLEGVLLVADGLDPDVVAERLPEDIPGIVRRTVIDDDDLELGITRRQHAADALADHLRAVVGRYDDGYARGCHLSGLYQISVVLGADARRPPRRAVRRVGVFQHGCRHGISFGLL